MCANEVRRLRPIRPVLIVLAAATSAVAACAHPLERNLAAFQDAKRRGDHETAGRYLAADAQIWFDKKKGEGAPLTARGGSYADWDREFRSVTTREGVRINGNTLIYESEEINDFYRLIERAPTRARITYFFNGAGRITGMLYVGLTPPALRPPDRFDAFNTWAAERYRGLLDSPEMRIPNNPARWRALLNEWRESAGLPSIE